VPLVLEVEFERLEPSLGQSHKEEGSPNGATIHVRLVAIVATVANTVTIGMPSQGSHVTL
jgi:hypothetical protein